jgi:hypothetical protein
LFNIIVEERKEKEEERKFGWGKFWTACDWGLALTAYIRTNSQSGQLEDTVGRILSGLYRDKMYC